MTQPRLVERHVGAYSPRQRLVFSIAAISRDAKSYDFRTLANLTEVDRPAPSRSGLWIEEENLPIHMDQVGGLRLWSYVTERWRLTVRRGSDDSELFDRDPVDRSTDPPTDAIDRPAADGAAIRLAAEDLVRHLLCISYWRHLEHRLHALRAERRTGQ